MTQVFDGLRVIDFSWGMAGGIATMVMADNGATVVKVEPPEGDPFRSMPAFVQWHRGKWSVVIDLKTEEGRCQAQRLAATADVVVESFRPGVANRLGISYEALSRHNPALVYCSITGFGRYGPYAAYQGYEGVVLAKSGRMMEFEGQLERPGPVYAAVPVASFAASQLALQGILAALYVREYTGRGQQVYTSLLQGVDSYDAVNWLTCQLHDRFPAAFPASSVGMRAGPSYHYLVAPTKDGHWVQCAHAAKHLLRAFLRAIDLEDAFKDAGLADEGLAAMIEPTEELWELLLLRMQDKTLAEWREIFARNPDISVEPFRTTQEALDFVQETGTDRLVCLIDPAVGETQQLPPLVTFTRTPSCVTGPCPQLGQHTREVLASLAAAKYRPPRRTRALPRHALDGVTVLEMAGFIAVPYGTALLADLGARVIKVEPPAGDPIRGAFGGTKMVQGKQSLTVDVRRPEGRRIVHELVRRADLFVHNFRPGVPERLGVDYRTLGAINPRLVYLDASAYGGSGPYTLRAAFHPTFGAICGGVRYQAGSETPPPPGTALSLEDVKRISRHLTRANDGNPDFNAAHVVATALLMGLFARERTGMGQRMETTMLRSNAYANSDDFIRYPGKPSRRGPDAECFGLGALYRLYRCREGWVFLACPTQKDWQRLCDALERTDLAIDPRFATPAARDAHDSELAAVLGQLFGQGLASRWEAELAGRGVACVVADAGRYYEFFHRDPQIDANGMAAEVEHAVWGRYRRRAPGVELSLTPGTAGPGNRTGEHTRLILSELGYHWDEMKRLKELGVIDWPDERWSEPEGKS